MATPLLTAADVWKLYPDNGVQALAGAALEVMPGSVHAVVGENGAGKSTLMHVLAGIVVADRGCISLMGSPIPSGDPAEARRRGIVISYQHPRLVRTLTVLENLFLGEEPRGAAGMFDRKAALRAVTRKVPGFPPPLADRRLASLSSGQVRLVSLAAALLRLPEDRPGVLILDEPTEASTPAEVERIFAVMRAAAEAGHGILFITHRLPEVNGIADRVAVMAGGRTVATLERPVAIAQITSLMVRSAVGERAETRFPCPSAAQPQPGRAAAERLRLEHVSLRIDGRWLLRDVSLAFGAGEIVGITGIRENGIEALEQVLSGACRITSGSIVFDGVDVTGEQPRELRRRGLRYVPTDRLLDGASLDASVTDNLIALQARRLHRYGFLTEQAVDRWSSRLADVYSISGRLSGPLRHLSGGNIQRVILARELAGHGAVLVICEPSWGLDLAGRTMVVEGLCTAAREGALVLVLSTDIDEVREAADRIVVLYDGRVAADGPSSLLTRDRIGRLMGGAPDG